MSAAGPRTSVKSGSHVAIERETHGLGLGRILVISRGVLEYLRHELAPPNHAASASFDPGHCRLLVTPAQIAVKTPCIPHRRLPTCQIGQCCHSTALGAPAGQPAHSESGVVRPIPRLLGSPPVRCCSLHHCRAKSNRDRSDVTRVVASRGLGLSQPCPSFIGRA